jgi:PKD repeat protein
MNKKKILAIITCLLPLTLLMAITSTQAQTQTTLAFDKPNYIATSVDETFTLTIDVTNVQNLWAWEAAVEWNPEHVRFVGSVEEGPFLKQGGASTLFIPKPAREGYIQSISSVRMAEDAVSGSGVLANLTFQVIKPCVESPINLVNTTLFDRQNALIDKYVPNPTMVVSLIGGGPIANAGLPQTVDEGTQVSFNGSKSYPTDGTLTYTWSFTDDGVPNQLSGSAASYTFSKPGIYDVTLTVQNPAGDTSTDTVQITVNDKTPPVPIITITGLNSDGKAGISQNIHINSSDSYDPEGGRIVNRRWNVEGDESMTGEDFNFQFSIQGTYTIGLTVWDKANNTATTSKTITVSQTAGNDGDGGSDNNNNNNNGNSNNSNGNNSNNDNGDNSNNNSQSQMFNLPPLAIGIIATMTILTITGSAFWLRKRTKESI